ncbi:MAG: transcriptional antiterminator [Firmicutes bacterium HGW-Firmicutes-15]|nr:MAG: transcriptional antiterminator [Firmicutes bacterium HGW-Firmicutes-15]
MKYAHTYGGLVNAIYTPQELEEYNDNPLIEALPDIFSQDSIIDRLFILPVVSAKDREQPSDTRRHKMQRLKRCIIPWGVHIELEQNLSIMLRQGYIARNLLDGRSFQNLLHLISQQDETDTPAIVAPSCFKDIESSALTLSLIGISGIGKTTAINKLLKMYPQVIRHDKYNGIELNRQQIVWLKMDCPFDGSLKTFCQSFFEAVDAVLETRYYEKYGNARNSRGKMMIDMERIATLHSIGVIAIDEMQHLMKDKNTDYTELLNFLVTLENQIGVPIIMIGTFKILEILKKELRQSRRATSQAGIIWDRLSEGAEWELFISSLWELQWLQKPTPFSEEFAKLMYEESQGITAIAVLLFLKAQMRALDNEETITKRIIRDTAKKDLFMVRPIISALKNNDIKAIEKYQDVAANLATLIENHEANLALNNKISEHSRSLATLKKAEARSKVEFLTIDLIEAGMFPHLLQRDLEEIATSTVNKLGVQADETKLKQEAYTVALKKEGEKSESKNRKDNSMKQKVEKDGLIYLYQKAVKDKRHIYELLSEVGLIKNAKEFC